jgi:CHAT domain-containing protein
MAQFYRELRAGSTKGAALRSAQRAILSDHPAHPFHWAPFQMVGDSSPL